MAACSATLGEPDPAPLLAAREALAGPILEQACKDGVGLLEALCMDAEGDFNEAGSHFPQFLPLSRALVFLKSVKCGSGVGIHAGHGFIVARLPDQGSGSAGGSSAGGGSASGSPASSSTGSAGRFSAPCFVRVEGVEMGILWGVEQVETLLGVLSERAFEDLVHKRKLTLGAEWSLALWPLGCESFEQPLAYNDLAMARVGRGWMFDVAVAGDLIRMDAAANAACYGEWATPEAILSGAVPPPPSMEPLGEKLRLATNCAVAACFEPAWHRQPSTKLD